jgi:D-alanyl-D-alanine carboxypeptidase (penicillin-binding protein 5/6)
MAALGAVCYAALASGAVAVAPPAVAPPAVASPAVASPASVPAAPVLTVSGACLYATGTGTGPSAGQTASPPGQAGTGSARPAPGGEVLYGVNENAELPIASTTKLMTALVTLQHVHQLSLQFTQNDYYASPADSQIGLVPGERMSVHDLLIALMLPSADDAAEDLAYNVGGGSVSRFISMMNGEAQALGLTRTHYSTPVGFDTPGNYSSPCDLDRLAAYDLATSPYFARVVALPSAMLWSGRYARHVINRLDLVGKVPWIHGVKTGHTAAAGYVAVAEGVRNGITLIASVLGTSSEPARDANTLALLDWGFSNYRLATPLVQGQVVARPLIRGGAGKRGVVIAAAPLRRLVSVSDRVQVRAHVPGLLTGPLPWHLVIAEATMLVDGRAVAEVPLELARGLPAPAKPNRPPA